MQHDDYELNRERGTAKVKKVIWACFLKEVVLFYILLKYERGGGSL